MKQPAPAVALPVVSRVIPKIADFNRFLRVDALFANKLNDLLNDDRKRVHYVRNTLLESDMGMKKKVEVSQKYLCTFDSAQSSGEQQST